MCKSALVIGTFTATETGYAGSLDTFAIKANLTLERNKEEAQNNHPDFNVLCGDAEIGVAWEHEDDRGLMFPLVSRNPVLRPALTKS
jgi:uncharacterized protein (DUF736 family)